MPSSEAREGESTRLDLTIKAGAQYAEESDPPDHRTANLATDVTVPIWLREEDVPLVERVLAWWNEVAVRRSHA